MTKIRGAWWGVLAFSFFCLSIAADGYAKSVFWKKLPLRGLAARSDKPFPTPTKTQSSLPTAEAGDSAHYITHDYQNEHPKVHSGVDLIKLEHDVIKKAIRDAKNPKDLTIILVRYEVGDPDMIDVLIEAKKAGIGQVTVITDLNTSYSYDFQGEELTTTDFAKGKLKEGPIAEGTEKLLGAGFKFNDPKYGIFSQPLFRTSKDGKGIMIPIMHEKELHVFERGPKGKQTFLYSNNSTSNLTNNPRYNRLIEVTDTAAIQYQVDHAEAMMKAFGAGKTIKEIESAAPLRIEYKDGSFRELAFTDGKINPNDRLADLLKRGALDRGDPGFVELKSVTMSHFVLTNGDVVEALRVAMGKQSDFAVSGVFDDKFVGLNQFGMAAALAGFNVVRPFGKTVFGFPSRLRARLNDVYIYQRDIPGRTETEFDGPPLARHIWHDKTTVIEVIEGGKPWIYVFTGSLNNSMHFDNAELQTMYRFPADSKYGQAFADSIMKPARLEKEYAIPVELAVFRGFIARLTGRRTIEVSVESAEKIMRAFITGRFVDANREMMTYKNESTTLREKITPEEIESRVRRLMMFVDWYKGNKNINDRSRGMSTRKIISAGMPIAFPDIVPFRDKMSIESALWEPNLSKEKIAELAKEAWSVMEISDAFPVDRPRTEKGGESDTEKDVEPNPDVNERQGGSGASSRNLKLSAICDAPLVSPLFKLDVAIPE